MRAPAARAPAAASAVRDVHVHRRGDGLAVVVAADTTTLRRLRRSSRAYAATSLMNVIAALVLVALCVLLGSPATSPSSTTSSSIASLPSRSSSSSSSSSSASPSSSSSSSSSAPAILFAQAAAPMQYINMYTDEKCEKPVPEVDDGEPEVDLLAELKADEGVCATWVCDDAGTDLRATLYLSLHGSCEQAESVLTIDVKGEPDQCVSGFWNAARINEWINSTVVPTTTEEEEQEEQSAASASPVVVSARRNVAALHHIAETLESSQQQQRSQHQSQPRHGILQRRSHSHSHTHTQQQRWTRVHQLQQLRRRLLSSSRVRGGGAGENDGLIEVGLMVNCGTPLISDAHWATFTVLTVLAGVAFLLGTAGALVYRRRHHRFSKPAGTVETSESYRPPSAVAEGRGSINEF